MNSDKIRTGRKLPEHRNKLCLSLEYPENLPTTSIIIPFHNELRSTLLRTIISIFQTVPEHLLKAGLQIYYIPKLMFLKIKFWI